MGVGKAPRVGFYRVIAIVSRWPWEVGSVVAFVQIGSQESLLRPEITPLPVETP